MEDQIHYLNETEVSKLTSISKSKLQNDRWLMKGIPYSKVGRKVLYNKSDVIAYMEACKIDPESEIQL